MSGSVFRRCITPRPPTRYPECGPSSFSAYNNASHKYDFFFFFFCFYHQRTILNIYIPFCLIFIAGLYNENALVIEEEEEEDDDDNNEEEKERKKKNSWFFFLIQNEFSFLSVYFYLTCISIVPYNLALN